MKISSLLAQLNRCMYEKGQREPLTAFGFRRFFFISALCTHSTVIFFILQFFSDVFVYSFYYSMVLCMRYCLFTLHCIGAIICKLCIIIFPIWIITKLILEVIWSAHKLYKVHAATFLLQYQQMYGEKNCSFCLKFMTDL